MDENLNQEKSSKVNATIDAVSGIVKAIPIYQDTLQPAAKQIGKSIETVAKTVNLALAPIKILVWGYDQIEEFISTSVSKKLENISEDRITSPSPQVAGPAIEALRFSGNDVVIRELYANLLATAMDKETIHKAHPAYVDILKNMVSDEALLVRCFIKEHEYPIIDLNSYFKDASKGYYIVIVNHSNFNNLATFQRPDLISTYIVNLCRLGILEIPDNVHLVGDEFYEPLINALKIQDEIKRIEEDPERKIEIKKKVISLTPFGKQFVESVVMDKI